MLDAYLVGIPDAYGHLVELFVYEGFGVVVYPIHLFHPLAKRGEEIAHDGL